MVVDGEPPTTSSFDAPGCRYVLVDGNSLVFKTKAWQNHKLFPKSQNMGKTPAVVDSNWTRFQKVMSPGDLQNEGEFLIDTVYCQKKAAKKTKPKPKVKARGRGRGRK